MRERVSNSDRLSTCSSFSRYRRSAKVQILYCEREEIREKKKKEKKRTDVYALLKRKKEKKKERKYLSNPCRIEFHAMCSIFVPRSTMRHTPDIIDRSSSMEQRTLDRLSIDCGRLCRTLYFHGSKSKELEICFF